MEGSRPRRLRQLINNYGYTNSKINDGSGGGIW